ncbi:mediator of RNA polymerase II transcription subunit 8 [Echria macrotheca]|uniref:Mediator of RNA polymerase II transcription subunit 8 n=1 Tax=Echria macrotheca TaxID=438768 RepID=A0AAJ0FBJ4_9PEZI|nr:mediator of RNA polymerase II transcription subunit 8 [Echria macrotheca]
MSSLGLAPDEVRQLDVLRQRLAQLVSSLQSLHESVATAQPLPTRESLQASTTILQRSISSIQDLMKENAHLFQRLALHPSTNFPGREHEGILTTLLRKKPELEMEQRVEAAREAARAAGVDPRELAPARRRGGAAARRDGGDGGEYGGYGDEDDGDGVEGDVDDDDDDDDGGVPSDRFNEYWADVRHAAETAIRKYIETQAMDPYTAEERRMGVENVRTGLRRALDEGDEEDDEEDEDEDEDDDEDEDMEGGGGQFKTGGGGAMPLGPEGQAAGVGGGVPGQGQPDLLPDHLLLFAARGDIDLPANVTRSKANAY